MVWSELARQVGANPIGARRDLRYLCCRGHAETLAGPRLHREAEQDEQRIGEQGDGQASSGAGAIRIPVKGSRRRLAPAHRSTAEAVPARTAVQLAGWM